LGANAKSNAPGRPIRKRLTNSEQSTPGQRPRQRRCPSGCAAVKARSPLLGGGTLQLHRISHGLQTVDEMGGNVGLVASVEVASAHVDRVSLSGQHVAGNHENGVADGQSRLLFAASPGQASVQRSEIVLRAGRGGARALARAVSINPARSH